MHSSFLEDKWAQYEEWKWEPEIPQEPRIKNFDILTAKPDEEAATVE